jgi:hypothetical protein
MRRQRATASAVLASISLFVWAVYSLVIVAFLDWDVRGRYGINAEGNAVGLSGLTALSLMLTGWLIGWLGQIVVWYLLIAYRGRTRPGRLRWLAIGSFAASAILFFVEFAPEGVRKNSVNEFVAGMIPVLLPLGLGGAAAFMLPVKARGDAEFVLPPSATVEAGPTIGGGP